METFIERQFDIRRIDRTNREAVDEFILRQWFSLEMVVHGETIDLAKADGWFVFEKGTIIGLITYRIMNNEMEILSLDSLSEGRGIGTALLNEAIKEAQNKGCSRIMLITTNDNTLALRFYQKRGFDMVRLYRNALEESRKIKPQIPMTGNDGIPIKHEIELEIKLN